MEFWDLYDAERNSTGGRLSRGEAIPAGALHLVVHVCVFDGEGRLLIQQRQHDKAGWPGLRDLSAGGSALAGETSIQAAQRETMEELGLAVDLTDVRPMLTIHFEEGFDDVYVVEQTVDLAEMTPQPSEVQAVAWASREEILAMITAGQFIPYQPAFLELLFHFKTRRGLLPANYGGVSTGIYPVQDPSEMV